MGTMPILKLCFFIVGADPVCVNSTVDYGYANQQPCALVHVSKVCYTFCMCWHSNFKKSFVPPLAYLLHCIWSYST